MSLSQEEQRWLTLALVPGVGTTHFIRLLARFRSPEAVLSASREALREVVGPKLSERITQYAEVVDLSTQERLMGEYEASLLTMNASSYPLALGEIYDPPLVLFVRGALKEQDEYAVAIVGTRKATPYGIQMAEKLARELAARGITIVSGLAAGIDAAAHRGALEAGGRTIAVLGCGVDVVYPRHNADLMHAIIQSGAVISQFPMGVSPSPGHFPLRNRIISGISKGTIIVEAPSRSGALITAHAAVEQGREVFAVPGQVGKRNSEGPHALIREGAKLVENIEDVLVELNLPTHLRTPVATPAPTPQKTSASSQEVTQVPAKPNGGSQTEREVLSVLSPDGSFVDEIAAACRIPISQALGALTTLELKGMIRQFSGKRFAPR